MRKSILVFATVTTLGMLATSGANAMPVGPALPLVSGVDQVRWVCNEWGRCWWRRDYYRPYGYYGDGYRWPHRHDWRGYYAPRYYGGYGYGWRRHWNDDDDDD